MCGCGRTSTLRGMPGGKSIGPMWSKNTNGPTIRCCWNGSTRPHLEPAQIAPPRVDDEFDHGRLLGCASDPRRGDMGD